MSFRVRIPFFRLVLALCLLLALASFASADELPRNYSEAMRYVKDNQPMEATVSDVTWQPKQLMEIRKALPEGAVFHFSTQWNNITLSDDMEVLDLAKIKKVLSEDTLRYILALCPNLKTVDNSAHSRPSNDVFIPLMEEYPDIRFEWVVHLRGEHYCRTDATAYSTLNHTDGGTRLTSADLELLRYVPGLKSLDLGHNAFSDLSFLRLYPDLELLIISNNANFDDLSEVGKLKHLKYLEIHNTNISDISPLAGCTELLDLNISSTRVTDLSALDGVLTLQRLWANNLKKMQQEEIDRFQGLHPDCLVDFTLKGSATSHHWRNHERYYHYRECFKTNIWIPFDETAPEE